MKIHDLDGLLDLRRTGLMKILPGKPRIAVGMGTCGIGNGAREVFAALGEALKSRAIDAQLTPVGCFGFCAAEPIVTVHLPGYPLVVLGRVQDPSIGVQIILFVAVVFGTLNVIGGFVVTDRMLGMFKGKKAAPIQKDAV